MSFDSKTNTITVGTASNFTADSGAFFVKVLRDLALQAETLPNRTASQTSVMEDWRTLERWLGCEGREPTDSDYKRAGETFQSYMAGSARTAINRDIYDVFDRMGVEPLREAERARRALRFHAALVGAVAEQKRVRSKSMALRSLWTRLRERIWLPQIVAALMLFFALDPNAPYEYYTVLRWVCCASFAYLAVQSFRQDKDGWVWVLGISAAVYNPLAPVHLTRDIWFALNVAGILIALSSIAAIRRPTRQSSRPRS